MLERVLYIGKLSSGGKICKHLENIDYAQLIDIQALLGHVDLATPQIYAHVSQDRMAAIVAKL